MKLAAAISAALCVNAAIAAPFTEQRRAARAKRLIAGRHSNPPKHLGSIAKFALDNSSNVQYSSNWAGAVLVGTDYQSVTGTIVIPTPKIPSGGSESTQYAASAWVGIDGDTCSTAILQTGIDVFVQNGQASFDAWYEWYPDFAHDFSGFDISAGDTITMTVTASSVNAGTATLENKTTGKTATQQFSDESAFLCETNAEWIVEDFSQGDSLVPFADFDTVTFTDALATTSSGSTVGVAGSQIFDIKQSNQVLTSCSVSGGSSVTCTYV